ncbi:hypothetical protein [Streptomyces sp. NPDC014006]|uniref:ABC transporter permease subunit n=1 Tax=Streptomyces sp. NPDC014006 TaxID=3364870 RepID=UPI0036FAC906
MRRPWIPLPALALAQVVLFASRAWAQDEVVPHGRGFGARFLQALIDRIQFGVVIAITAVGLSLIFGTNHLINFAHGEFVTNGGTFAFFLKVSPTGPGWHMVPAALVAVLLGALFGGAGDRVIWRPLRARGTGLINMFIVTIGLPLLLRHIVLILFGTRPATYAQYDRPGPGRHRPAGPHGHPALRPGAVRRRRAAAEALLACGP